MVNLNNSNDQKASITPREKECLYWITQGRTVEEVAEEMNISYRTALSYIHSIKQKLNCSTLAHSVSRAIQLGMINMIVGDIKDGSDNTSTS